MSQTEDISTLAKARLRQAQNALDAGQILIDQGLDSDSINRAYYAIVLAWCPTDVCGAVSGGPFPS